MTHAFTPSSIAGKAVALIALVCFSFAVQAQNGLTYVKRDKNPGASFLMSLVIPGSGQMYNDQVGLGFGVFGGTMALYGGGVALLMASNNVSEDVYYDWNTGELVDDSGSKVAYQASGIALIALGGLAHIASFVYAPIKSKAINKKNGETGSAYVPSTSTPYYQFGVTQSGGVGATLNF